VVSLRIAEKYLADVLGLRLSQSKSSSRSLQELNNPQTSCAIFLGLDSPQNLLELMYYDM
jgi:hypothetical protein